MSYNHITLTIVGNIAGDLELRHTRNGNAVLNLRIASTPRRRDRDSGEWIDDATTFMSVTCWRRLAENVKASMKKGDPVVVTGRLYSREYEVNEAKRITYELEAYAVGHDLSRGIAEFRRVSRPDAVVAMPVGDDGVPADESEHYLDLATGEVLQADPSDGDSAADDRELVPAG